jgi:hypothetical protein
VTGRGVVIGTLALLFAIAVLALAARANRQCTDRGGVLVRGPFWFVCVSRPAR